MKEIILLCFPDKENFHVIRATRCVGPFTDLEAASDWAHENNEHHWVTLNLETDK